MERVTFSPREFAALFGKSQTWGYRQIYAGRVKAITEYGRILIPAAEVERILATAAGYDGRPPIAAKTKHGLAKKGPQLKRVWQVYLESRRSGDSQAPDGPAKVKASAGWHSDVTSRKSALGRLAKTGRPSSVVRRN